MKSSFSDTAPLHSSAAGGAAKDARAKSDPGRSIAHSFLFVGGKKGLHPTKQQKTLFPHSLADWFEPLLCRHVMGALL